MENITPFNTHQIVIYKNYFDKEISHMVNIIVIKGKYHIHIFKWTNQKPSLICFKNEMKILFFSLLILADTNQYKTLSYYFTVFSALTQLRDL